MLTMVTMLQLHMCSNITVQVFSALTTLRKLCNHPDLVTNDYSEQVTLSGGNKKKKKASQIADTPKANIKSKHFPNMDPNPHTHTHTPSHPHRAAARPLQEWRGCVWLLQTLWQDDSDSLSAASVAGPGTQSAPLLAV